MNRADEFEEAAFAMARLQSEVAEHFQAAVGEPLFDITIKTHLVCHSAKESRHINPRLVWCFSGEDYMRRSQELAQSCVRGNKPYDVTNKMANHFRLGLHFEFEKMDQ